MLVFKLDFKTEKRGNRKEKGGRDHKVCVLNITRLIRLAFWKLSVKLTSSELRHKLLYICLTKDRSEHPNTVRRLGRTRTAKGLRGWHHVKNKITSQPLKPS